MSVTRTYSQVSASNASHVATMGPARSFPHFQEQTMLTKTSSPDLVETAITSQDAEYFEYTSSANPIGAKLISRVPFSNFSPSLYADGATRVVPLDLSAEL